MMLADKIEQLKRQYAGKRVTADVRRPELTRMAGKKGRVMTVNCNGRALVQFDGPDICWYDIDPKFLNLTVSAISVD
jgi:hypothetical protein